VKNLDFIVTYICIVRGPVMVNESLNNLEEDFEENESERVIVEHDEIPNHIVSVLILEEIFDINAIQFIKDPEDSDEDDDDDDNNKDDEVFEEEEPAVEDYNVEELTTKFID